MTNLPPVPPAPQPPPLSLPFRSGGLSERKPTRFRLTPDEAVRAAMAADLGLQAIKSFRFEGEITPVGRQEFVLSARMEAEVTQSCVVTLAPVPARLSEDVTRRFSREVMTPLTEELELSAEDGPDPLPEVLDVGEVAMEALALALPLYPRAKGAELGELVVAPPGAEPIREADLKPFASLAALKDKLSGGNSAE